MIFEGKNKAYGAFELRRSSWKRHLIAFGIIVLLLSFITVLPMIVSTIKAATGVRADNITDTYIMVDTQSPTNENEIVKPEVPEPPKYLEMAKFVPPTIVDDSKVDDTETFTAMEDLTKSTKAIGAFDVENGSKDPDAIRKEVEREITGTGTKEPEEVHTIFRVAEVMPQFPGGEKEMYKFISDNLKYPVVDQEMGIQGRVTVRFVVSKTGEITNIELVKGISPTCDKEAMRVIKNMPKWIPGKQSGTPVQVYFTMPIVFKLKS
jgi:protein TonB